LETHYASIVDEAQGVTKPGGREGGMDGWMDG